MKRRIIARKSQSLRRSLVIYLVIGSLLPLAVLGVMTYYSIYSILTNKIQSGISASLNQEAATLENTINNLDFASKQFALDGQIVDEVGSFLQEKQVYKKSQLMASINEKINLVNFTNPVLGVTAYVEPGLDDPVLFTNFSLSRDFGTDKLPPFMSYNGASYFGPHKTMYSSSNNFVFSSLRVVRVPGAKDVYIYLETNYNLFAKILSERSYGMRVTHLLVNEHGDMTYVENKDMPREALDVSWTDDASPHKISGGYHLFRYKSPQGWQLIAAVKQSTFNSEIYSWLYKLFFVALATLVFSVLLALFIWKQVYRPLRKVNSEIVRMAENIEAPVAYTRVEEFDLLLGNFQDMKTKINGLLNEVEHNEQQKSRLEIEKLLSQINPHFLHNTLNTVQWLARMNGQKEIDKLVTLLVKVLHYNLGKKSIIVTIQDEIDALQNYMELQRIRYDYEFEYAVDVDEAVVGAAIPRFLLQPLVENAIYHGTGERQGRVAITIRALEGGRVSLRVADNGDGIDPETAQRLLHEDPGAAKRGLGIGLSYVNRLLKQFYGERMSIDIAGVPHEGTTITIIIPRKAKEEFDD
ncbi:two-component system, sensor histidine kinase YesM [Paenibacillus sp. UNC496MF]|uniref:sensor histidine kinase n=1 Tax=Paenibacillus sp. UNC496MF TaxID=1502753 RepID=UPI0008F02345|nr:sensor histidine kinase [Paenibacillus sp. UNC496MF]SFJ22337.1 two-component system, sensor histidine kinase YesM [Paenibacillus sp. UNC496MF]